LLSDEIVVLYLQWEPPTFYVISLWWIGKKGYSVDARVSVSLPLIIWKTKHLP